MDLDEEIIRRLTNTEDHLTERKSKPQRDQCTEAMVAFANSALFNKPGILYIGVNDEGEILHDKAPESWQRDITAWGNGCFPELPVIPRTLRKDGKEFLAVVVPFSEARPHFARPAFKREGAKTIRASQNEIDEWIAYRSSKVRFILDWKGKTILIQRRNDKYGTLASFEGARRLLDCNEHFVIVERLDNYKKETHPLSFIDLKLHDNSDGQLMLLVAPYLGNV